MEKFNDAMSNASFSSLSCGYGTFDGRVFIDVNSYQVFICSQLQNMYQHSDLVIYNFTTFSVYNRSSSRRPLRVSRPPRDRSRLAAPRAPAALRMRSESRSARRAPRAIVNRRWCSSRSRWALIRTRSRTPPSVRPLARAPSLPPPRRTRAFSGRRRARSIRITRRSRTRRSTRATSSPSPPNTSLCRAGRSRSQTLRARCR